MSRFHNPEWLNFQGEPVSGKQPPREFIFGELTQHQHAMVAHAYKLFCDAYTTAIGEYMVRNRVLEDGTRVRLEHHVGQQDAVYVWPAGGGGKQQLPHGFAVVTNWNRPVIFKRSTVPSVAWATDASEVPQAKNDIETTNQVFRLRGPSAYFLHPMVRAKGAAPMLWDYLKHKAASVSTTSPVVPLCMPVGSTYKSHPAHFSYENLVLGPDGATIYTMTLADAILMDTPEIPQFAAAMTSANGNWLAMQHIRWAIVSPSTGAYQMRFANERISRIDVLEFAASERNVVGISGPIGSSGPGTVAPVSTLGDDVSADLVAYQAGNAAAGSGGSYTWVEGFFIDPMDLTSAAALTETAIREEGALTTTSPSTVAKSVALAKEDSIEYPNLVIEVGDSGTVLWRAGFKQLLASPTSPPLNTARWFGYYGYRKDRIDTAYSRSTAPVSKYQLGWADLKLFEGTSFGVCTGNTYTDTKYHGRSFTYWSDPGGFYPSNTYITAGSTAGLTADEILPYLISTDIKPTTMALVNSDPDGVTVHTVADNRPVNNGQYSYKSRHVIDFDNKGRFWAAIRVEVICTGAQWKENRSVFDGFMELNTSPSYTASIYFESNWNGTVDDVLLLTETAIRPPFEFVNVSKQNPYTYLTPLNPNQTMLVRMPPTFGLPLEALKQILTLCSNQGVNSHLACADFRPDITGPASAKIQSKQGIEFSTRDVGAIEPPSSFVTGQLYARTFKLSDFPDALWLLTSTLCNAKENNGTTGPAWFYMPTLGAAIASTTFHVEVRDGTIGTWSGEIGTGAPAETGRDIKLYRV